MKYFVYANRTNVKNPEIRDRAIYFVPETDLKVWATKFDPAIMEFCGVSVHAQDREEAKNLFLNPIDYDGFEKMICEDEPSVTRNKTVATESTADLMAQRLAKLWQHVDEMFYAMAQLYVLNHNNLTVEEAYKYIKNEWLNKYKEM